MGAIIAAFVLGEALGVIMMAILGGHIDRWLDMRQKKKGH